MSTRLRPGTLRAYALGLFCGSLMTATLTMCAAPAKADTINPDIVADIAGPVCSVTAQYPSTDGLIGIGAALIEDGWTGYEAGEIIATSIINYCPRYTPILRAFVARYGGNESAVA